MSRPTFLVLLYLLAAAALAQPGIVPISLTEERDLVRLVQTVQDPEAEPALRTLAAKRLGELGDLQAAPALIASLTEPAKELRMAALRALGTMRVGEAAQPVALLLRDPDGEVVMAAAEALTHLHDPATVAPMAAALMAPLPVNRGDADRILLATALGRIEGQEASDALRAYLQHNPGDTRLLESHQQAARALGRRRDARALPILLAQLAGDRPQQAIALAGLRALQSPESVTPLVAAFPKLENDLKQAAALALAAIRAPEAREALLKLHDETTDETLRAHLGLALVQAGDPRGIDSLLRLKLPDAFYGTDRPVGALSMSDVDVRLRQTALPRGGAPVVSASLATGGVRTLLIDQFVSRLADADLAKGIVDNATLRIEYDIALRNALCSSFGSVVADSEGLPALSWPPSPPIGFYVLQPNGRGPVGIDDAYLRGRLPGLLVSNDVRRNFGFPVAPPSLPKGNDPGMARERMMALVRASEPAGMRLLVDDVKKNGFTWQRGYEGMQKLVDPREEAIYGDLLTLLNHEDSGTRQVTCALLGACRDARAVPALIATLKTDKVAEVREFAALALGLIGDSRAVEPLSLALSDKVEWAKSAAAWALGEIGDKDALPALQVAAQQDKNTRFQVRVARSLHLLGNRDGAVLLADLTNAKDDMTRQIAYRALLEIEDPRLAGPLLGADNVPITVLARYRDPRVAAMLQERLEDEGADVRTQAAIGLGNQGDTKAIPVLQQVAERDEDARVRAVAAVALARLKAPTALALLTRAYTDCVDERNGITQALAKLDDPKVVGLLEEISRTEYDWSTRALASWGLARLGDARGAERLGEIVAKTHESFTRQLASRLAGEVKAKPAVAGLCVIAKTGTIPEGILAVEALGKIGDAAAVDTLTGLLASPSSRLREASAVALGRIKDRAALPALKAQLAREDASRAKAAMAGAVKLMEG